MFLESCRSKPVLSGYSGRIKNLCWRPNGQNLCAVRRPARSGRIGGDLQVRSLSRSHKEVLHSKDLTRTNKRAGLNPGGLNSRAGSAIRSTKNRMIGDRTVDCHVASLLAKTKPSVIASLFCVAICLWIVVAGDLARARFCGRSEPPPYGCILVGMGSRARAAGYQSIRFLCQIVN